MSMESNDEQNPAPADDQRTDPPPLCWHCRKRPADHGSAHAVRLHHSSDRPSETRLVVVPACPTCAGALRRIRLLWALVFGVVLLVIVAAITIDVASGTTLAHELAVLVGFIVPFLALLIGLVAFLRLTVRVGMANVGRGSYPEVKALKLAGWTTVRMSRGAYRSTEAAKKGLLRLADLALEESGPAFQKSCMACHSVVSPDSQVGQRCPHCHAYWSTLKIQKWPP